MINSYIVMSQTIYFLIKNEKNHFVLRVIRFSVMALDVWGGVLTYIYQILNESDQVL